MTHDGPTSTEHSETHDLAGLAWTDRHRPRFHFLSPGGWLNDPNGLTHWNGTYHLFYQYNPDAAVHANIHWGHATSADLVHWHDEPIALTPGDGPDADGCWSGILVDHDGTPTIVYSGSQNGEQRPCLATGDPELRTWRKDPANPVITEPPADLSLVAFRDHCVWSEDGLWYQLIGAGIRGVGGAALLYTSPDLRTWQYQGPLHVGDAGSHDPVWTGTMWECVELFPLADRHVLVLSAWDNGTTHHPVYYTGHYADTHFTADPPALLDYGKRYFYAPQTMRDDRGRRIMFGWIQEGRSDAAVVEAGWSGVMSLPRQVSLDAAGRLFVAPVAEVATLRGARTSTPAHQLIAGDTIWLEDVHGDQLDIEARITISEGAAVELAIRSTPDGAERTVLALDRANHEIRLDRTASSRQADLDTAPIRGHLPMDADGTVDLRILIDHSVVEVFANGRPLTARVYPTRLDALGVTITATGGSAHLHHLDAWTMTDIWTAPRALRP
ncbi:glycoside hydrolase family 32 protein [Micromonospora echinospora]|uniref:glycoside hydrolase family 32 protein n=1 Tax=Micromonospora echinospora TaxID=1877 RepID=UPI00378E138C